MCIFEDRSESPSHASSSTELTAPPSTETYEQQEAMSGVDMMIRHFRSQSFREYQLRNSPALSSRSLTRNSPALSSRSLTRNSPALSSRSLTRSSPTSSSPYTPQHVSRTSPSILHSVVIDFSTPARDIINEQPCTSISYVSNSCTSTPCISCSSGTLSSHCTHHKPYNSNQQRAFANLIADT